MLTTLRVGGCAMCLCYCRNYVVMKFSGESNMVSRAKFADVRGANSSQHAPPLRQNPPDKPRIPGGRPE